MKLIFSIPTYIINLEKRADRRRFSEIQFGCRPEFEVQYFKAIEDIIPAVGLYRSLHAIVGDARRKKLPFVLICEDDHRFTEAYHSDLLKAYLKRIEKYQVDVFAGGVSWFTCALRAEEDLYWIERFTGAQFLIICARFYDRILESPFHEEDIIDEWISGLSNRIFVAVPMFSVQHDFGYSDVTPKNNVQGRVDTLFSDTMERWKTLQEVTSHTQKGIANYHSIHMQHDMQLPTYVINRSLSSNQLAHITGEFHEKTEFDLSVVEITNDHNDAFILWETIHKIVKTAMENQNEVILICQDDHTFAASYSKDVLFKAIYEGFFLGADLILGGITDMQQVIPVSSSLCWTSLFQSTQFTIIYSSCYQAILDTTLGKDDSVDRKLSSLTANKYVIHPFISKRCDFEPADANKNKLSTHQYSLALEKCESRISKVRLMSRSLGNET